MTLHDVELLLDCRATIGESPTWSAFEAALYWIDVKEPALHRQGADGALRRWILSSDVGAFALLADASGAVVALRDGLFQLRFDDGQATRLAPPPFDPDLFRFNEGICDALGRFWVGVMFDPRPGIDAEPRAALLHRFTFADGLQPGPDQAELHNGFAWRADGTSFYWSHSNQGCVFQAPYDLATGSIGPRDRFTTIRAENALPDGAALDEEGCYWCAIHGGGALHRYDPAGKLLTQVALPVSQPTMCAFVGSDLDEMVVTSARQKLAPEQLAREPHAGGLFRLRPGVRGVPRPCIVR